MADRETPLPLLVLGATTCEDSAIVRSRLGALGIPFDDVEVDLDPAAARRVESLNGGHRITPTLVFGADELVDAEPTLERLGVLLREAGYPVGSPGMIEFHGELASRPVPLDAGRGSLADAGGDFSLGRLRGHREVVLFVAHDAGCLACFGYARRLADPAVRGEADAQLVVATGGTEGAIERWREEVRDALVLDDRAGWRRSVLEHTGESEPGGVGLLVLDRFLAPRAGSFAGEAGGLANPSDAFAWAAFVALDCPECAGELAWA